MCDDVLSMIEELYKKYFKVVSAHVEIQNITYVASVFGVFTTSAVIIIL